MTKTTSPSLPSSEPSETLPKEQTNSTTVLQQSPCASPDPNPVVLPDDPPVGPKQRTQECFALIQEFDKKTYTDLAGWYLYILSRGNQYIMVVYDYDSSDILVELLKNRTSGEITKP